MKRFSRMKSTAYSPVSTNIMGQSLIYNHMSHHYRRLYNAKSCVDCSPPRSLRHGQRVMASSCLKHCSDIPSNTMALVDELIYDTKLGPAAYCSQIKDWSACNCRSTSPGRQNMKATPVINKRPVKTVAQPVIMTDRHARCFDPPFSPFQPPVPKVNAQSKVRDLKVYHPPRKKVQKRAQVVQKSPAPGYPMRAQAPGQRTLAQAQGQAQALVQESLVPGSIPSKEEWKPEDQVDDGISSASSAGPWMQMPLYMEYPRASTVQKPSSEESSRDSAYNGGVSSGGESRGPTPEQSPGKPPAPPVHLTPVMEARLKRQKEEALYIQFIHEITQDVLSSGIFSNKGLRQVFQRHINLNKNKLDMERMKAEVAKLQIQLDMPDDEEDVFPLPSREDIVMGWPSPARDTDEQGSVRNKLRCYCSDKTVKMKVVDGLIMSPSEVIQSLREMGFSRNMAEEICQSLSDKDLQLTPELCRDMPSALSSEEDIVTRSADRQTSDRPCLCGRGIVSKESIGQTSDRPCLCGEDMKKAGEVSERRQSSAASATGSPLSSQRETNKFEDDERIVSPRYSGSSAETILTEIIEDFIESAHSSQRDLGQIERRDTPWASKTSGIILRDINEKLNGSFQRESEQTEVSERRRSSQISVTAARLVEGILAQCSDSPQPLSVGERRDSSPRSSPRYSRTSVENIEQLRASSHSSRESKVYEVRETSSKTISEKRSPPSRVSSGSSKKLDLIQETAELPDDVPKCTCYADYRCCKSSGKSQISKPKGSDAADSETLVSIQIESSATFRTNSLGSTNQSGGAEDAELSQGTSSSVNKAEGGNVRPRSDSEKSESLKITEARRYSVSNKEDLEDEDKSSVIEEDISTADDVSEELHSVKEETSEGCTSSDSSISVLPLRLKELTVDKDAFQPSSFPADVTDLVPREQLSRHKS